MDNIQCRFLTYKGMICAKFNKRVSQKYCQCKCEVALLDRVAVRMLKDRRTGRLRRSINVISGDDPRRIKRDRRARSSRRKIKL